MSVINCVLQRLVQGEGVVMLVVRDPSAAPTPTAPSVTETATSIAPVGEARVVELKEEYSIKTTLEQINHILKERFVY